MAQQEGACEVDYFGCVGQSGYASVAIEVGSESDMFYSHYLYGMDEVVHGVDNGGLSAVAKESVVQGYLCHAVFLCECPHLVVGEIAWVFAECSCRTVAANDGGFAEFECVVETCLCGMAHVYEYSQSVHLCYDFAPEGAEASVFCVAFGGIADVVVAIVAECHVDDAALFEVLEQADVSSDGVSVFDAFEYGFFDFCFELEDVVSVLFESCVLAVGLYDVVYLCEQCVGFFSCLPVGDFVAFSLWEVCHHDGCIEASFCHFGQVDEYFVGACAEHLYVLLVVVLEEHWCVAVAVQDDGCAVYVFCLGVDGCLAGEPLEDGHHALVCCKGEAFGMPLDAEQCFVLVAFYGFDDAVGTCG